MQNVKNCHLRTCKCSFQQSQDTCVQSAGDDYSAAIYDENIRGRCDQLLHYHHLCIN